MNRKSKLISSKITLYLSSIFEELEKKNDNDNIGNNIKKIKKILSNGIFNNYQQQDCQEFLKFLLNQIHKENSKKYSLQKNNFDFNKKKSLYSNFENFYTIDENFSNSFVNKLFEGIFFITFICSNCKNKIYKFEKFFELNLDLFNNIKNTSSSKIPISELIKNYFSKEKISNFICEKCKKNTTLVKKVKIIKFPEILIILIKRFTFFPEKRKIKNHIDFSNKKFSLSNLYIKYENEKEKIAQCFFSSEKLKGNYKLMNFINHYGDIDIGHYSAICFNSSISKWIHFNDQKVSAYNHSNIIHQSSSYVYILFYERYNK
jgi:ubiquitin carboxyl-terminal hydrolase 2/21